MTSDFRMGAWLVEGGVRWRVWAPDRRRVELVLFDAAREETSAFVMEREAEGWFSLTISGAGKGTLYKFRVDGEGPFPDPASRSQPHGVHGPSEVIDDAFSWTDRHWRGHALEEVVIYEVHVGTATREGTFDALIGRLDHIRALGATAIELMPVASFPGRRNWGYDGVDLFAPAAIYGGPAGLKRLIDAAHGHRLAVLIDVVYNHFGPDGNYLRLYAELFFTDRHTTPWGAAVNFDGDGAQPVREFFLANAEMWIRDFHADGLRLDAIHAICDDSTPHILQQIAERARRAGGGRQILVTAEDERNEARLLRAPPAGFGLDAVWADDFHHQLRRAFAGDREGYYADFTGSSEDIAATLRGGWFFQGQHSKRLGHGRGTRTDGLPLAAFVCCIQNHDQIGNRAFGDRLGASIDRGCYQAASALLLFSPETPLLFMGQEWNASPPFLYFTDHEPDLGRLVTEGRRSEFKAFAEFQGAEIPDPQAEQTFLRSKLDWSELSKPEHAGMLAWYRALLSLRASHPAMKDRSREALDARGEDDLITVERRAGASRLILVVALRGGATWSEEGWRLVLHSGEPRFGGAGEITWEGDSLQFTTGGAAVLERTG